MSNILGRTVRLFLVEGNPNGIVTAEIMNWTGHVLVAPRSRLADALKREEASRTGVYFLVGDDPDQPTRSKVYVGEGDNVADRIKNHDKDEAKDYWTRVCIVSSKDTNLNKAHARYLENRLVSIIKSSDRANLGNGNDPSEKQLSESDIADMEFFLSQIQVVLPVVGFEFLRPKLASPPKAIAEAQTFEPSDTYLELVLESKKHGVHADAIDNDGEFVVLQNSTAVLRGDFALNQYGHLRQDLVADGRLILTEDGRFYRFAEDVPFKSPSAAAAVVFDRNSNGRTSWKLTRTGQTLKEWQEAQLASVPTEG
jgi:hypothetical protein